MAEVSGRGMLPWAIASGCGEGPFSLGLLPGLSALPLSPWPGLGALLLEPDAGFDLRLGLGEVVAQLDYLLLALGAVGIVTLALALTLALTLTFALAIAAVLALPVALSGSFPGIALAISAARGVLGGLLWRRALLLLPLQLTHHFGQPRELLLRRKLGIFQRVGGGEYLGGKFLVGG